MSDQWARHATDPNGRDVVFDAGSHLHLAEGERDWLLDHVDAVIGVIERPDHRDEDPIPGRERFYRANFLEPGRWLRVVVDFNEQPGWVVTEVDQWNDPRLRKR
jgi:hypothetical protein